MTIRVVLAKTIRNTEVEINLAKRFCLTESATKQDNKTFFLVKTQKSYDWEINVIHSRIYMLGT